MLFGLVGEFDVGALMGLVVLPPYQTAREGRKYPRHGGRFRNETSLETRGKSRKYLALIQAGF